MLNFISRQMMKKRFHDFSRAQKDIEKAQEQAFQYLKANNATPIKAKSFREFVKDSPEQRYDDVAIFHEMKKKPHDFGVHYFALTSGSTGPSKKIPFNKGVGHIFKRSQFTSCALLCQRSGLNPIFTDTVVWGCPQDLEPKIQGIDCGSGSGYLGRSPSKWLQRNRFPSVETQNIIHFDSKVEALLKECGNRDVKAIGAIPTYFEFLMQTIFKQKNIKSLVELWPNMQVYLFSGTSLTQHKERLFEMVGKELLTMGIYFCSECPIGFEAHSLERGLPGYLLNVEDVVFGFSYEDGTVATYDEVQEGDDVRILVSMPNGFRNYMVGDRVRITSKKPYLTLEPLGREGVRMDMFGEKIPERDLQLAVKHAAENLGILPEHFFVYPSQDQYQKFYQWVLVQDSGVSVEKFNQAIDECLMKISDPYRVFRKEIGLLSQPKSEVIGNELTHKIFNQKSHRGQLKFKSIFNSKVELDSYLRG